MSISAWATAASVVLPYGCHQGRTIDDLASTDDGLLYLDWLRGNLDEKARSSMRHDAQLRRHLRSYLDDRTIADDLRRVLERQ